MKLYRITKSESINLDNVCRIFLTDEDTMGNRDIFIYFKNITATYKDVNYVDAVYSFPKKEAEERFEEIHRL